MEIHTKRTFEMLQLKLSFRVDFISYFYQLYLFNLLQSFLRKRATVFLIMRFYAQNFIHHFFIKVQIKRGPVF